MDVTSDIGFVIRSEMQGDGGRLIKLPHRIPVLIMIFDEITDQCID